MYTIDCCERYRSDGDGKGWEGCLNTFLRKEMSEIDFTEINKHLVSIASYRNQLAKCERIDEITRIKNAIIEAELKIFAEREKGLKVLQNKKEEILQKTAHLQIELDNLKTELDTVNVQLATHTEKYKSSVFRKIADLEGDGEKK